MFENTLKKIIAALTKQPDQPAPPEPDERTEVSPAGSTPAVVSLKQVSAGGHVTIEAHQYLSGAPAPDDSTALCDAYLSRLLETCRQVFLSGIDRIAARQGADTCLNLEAIYTALLTLSVEHEGQEKHSRMPEFLEGGRERRLSALEQLNRRGRLVLLGEPGSGKSTFVNFVAMCLAGERLKNPQINLDLLTQPLPSEKENQDDAETPERQEWSYGTMLPVRVILRDFAAEGLPPAGQQATANHLWQFIADGLQQTPFSEYIPSLKQRLLQHGGLVLLDGLDEVPEAMQRRTQLKQAVEDFGVTFRPCRILVTSRTYAYQQQDWQLTGFEKTVLAPFSQGQIRHFVTCWYAHNAPLLGMRPGDARQRAELLKRAIFDSRRLSRFAERPLLLTLMASLHAWRGGSLPEKRQELYESAVDLLLDWWESRKVKDPDGQWVSLTGTLQLGREGLDGLRQLMNHLAYDAHATQADLEGTANIEEDALAGGLMRLIREHETNREHEINPIRLADYLRDRAGLLVSHGVGLYTFPHRTFQEYLAACYLTEQDEYPENVAQLARCDPNRWREALLLAGAKAAQGAASTIWALAEELCYRQPHDRETCVEDAWGALLAGQALIETANLKHISPRNQPKCENIQRWLTAILTAQIPVEDPFPAVERARAGNILAVLGDQRPGVQVGENGLPDILWCEVPAGEFLMGSDKKKDPQAYGDEEPQHRVTLSAYSISRYPVTNAQYQAFVDDGGYTETWKCCWGDGWAWKEEEAKDGPTTWGGEFDLPNHPVVMVSWHEAAAFCQWVTLRLRETRDLTEPHLIRLPTEAEWEKAARGEDGRIYPWGNDDITPEHANYAETGLGATSTVGCFPNDTSPYICQDMTGNVWEWCADWFDETYYTKSPQENPPGPESVSNRVFRGGAWSGDARNCRSAYRDRLDPGGRVPDLGFRLVRT